MNIVQLWLVWLIGAACFMFVPCTNGANILLLPLMNTSHFLEMDGVGRPLVARGHNVYVLLDEKLALPKAASGFYTLVTHRSGRDYSMWFDTKAMHNHIENPNAGLNLSMIFEPMKQLCIGMLSDPELLPKLRSLKLDLVILDNGPLSCLFVLSHVLGVPYVTVGTPLFSWSARVPVLPSVVQPTVGLDAFGVSFCEETPDQLGIVRRFCRLISLVASELLFTFVEEDYMRQYVDFPSVKILRENASLNIVNHNYLLSTPLPKLPNVEYVGGLTTRPPKPLEDSLDKWMSLAPNVVVVSFGSMFPNLPATLARKLFDAFGRMSQYRFLMRFKSEDSKAYDVPHNVRVMDWLPQNDALAHKSTRAFITHSGNNGQQEALYNGVPMMCFYLFGDQKGNALRVLQRGYGKMLSIHDFTVEQLVAYVTELVDNDTYSSRIKLASAVFHSEKHPSERAADAVEHVLKYGAEHLRNKEAYSLSLWQFYMLDVLAVLYAIVLVVLLAVRKVTKTLLRKVLGIMTNINKTKTE